MLLRVLTRLKPLNTHLVSDWLMGIPATKPQTRAVAPRSV